jgi:hypothetical protein
MPAIESFDEDFRGRFDFEDEADAPALRLTESTSCIERCVRAEARVDADRTTVDVDFYPGGYLLQVTIQGFTVADAAFELVATGDPDEGVKLALAA